MLTGFRKGYHISDVCHEDSALESDLGALVSGFAARRLGLVFFVFDLVG